MNAAPPPAPPPVDDPTGRLAKLWNGAVDNVAAISGGLWKDVWSGLTDWIPGLGKAGWTAMRIGLVANQDVNREAVIEHVKTIFAMPEAMENEALEIEKMPWPLGWLLSVYLRVIGPVTLMKHKIGLALLPAAHKAAQTVKSDIPPVEILLREFFRSPHNRTLIEGYLEEHNFGPTAQSVMLAAVQNFGDLSTIFALRNRGIIDDDAEALSDIQKLGFNEDDAKNVFSLRHVIPALPDIIRMAVREAFSPAAIERFQLDEAYPEGLTKWAGKQGLTEDWAKAYWRAHWDLPSISQGFEMLWRTDFSDSDLDMLMRVADINPYFRPFLKQIAYHPLTRVDVRRMYTLGVLNEESRGEVTEAYKHLGYNELNAQRMTEFTIRYENRSKTANLAKKVLWAYESGLTDKRTTVEDLEDLFHTHADALYEVALIDAELALDARDDELDRIRGLYTSRRITRDEASDLLDIIESNAQRKADLIDKWGVKRKAKARYPTKTELDNYFKSGVISKEEWLAEMENLGFAGKYTQWRLDYMIVELGGQLEEPTAGT